MVLRSPKPVWLDCDPGHDDAMAIILAGYNPRLKLLGVSTVHGNQTIDKTTENAVQILAASGLRHVGVAKGQAKPLMRQPKFCPEIHGASGLDGPQGKPLLRAPHQPLHFPRAVPHMFEVISQHYQASQEKVHLVATGALTNVALLTILYPEVADMVDITIMGGAMGIGNTGPVQEFNMQIDPEAARVVFESRIPLTMVPLEVTHTALATPDVLRRICPDDAASPFRKMIRDLLLFFAKTYKAVFDFDDPPIHDPTAVAYIIDPSLFTTELMRVDIETESRICSGQTVCDVWHQSSEPKNANVAQVMDVPAFWDYMCDAVDAADAASPMNTEGVELMLHGL